MNNSYRNLVAVCGQWSDKELKLLLEALQRDRSFDLIELSQYLSTKNSNQIRELINILLSVEENELLDSEKKPPHPKPEGSIDILIQTSRHLSGSEYNYSSSIAELIEQFASWSEPDSIIKYMGFSYSEIYFFLSALFMGKTLPDLSPFAAGAMLDLLTCLVRLLGIIDSQTSETDQDPNSKYAELHKQKEIVSSRITDKMGIYLAGAAGIYLLNLLYSHRRRVTPKATLLPPVAPLYVYGSVEYPKTIKATRYLVQNITESLKDIWSLPSFPSKSDQQFNENSTKIKIPLPVFKRLAAYSLNPFCFSMELMNPFQSLLDEFINLGQSRLNHLSDLTRLMPALLPLTTPCLFNLRRRRKAKRPRIQTDIDEEDSSDETTCSDTEHDDSWSTRSRRAQKSVIVRPLQEGRWRTSKYFVRVMDPKEDTNVMRRINKMVVIQETKQKPAKRMP